MNLENYMIENKANECWPETSDAWGQSYVEFEKGTGGYVCSRCGKWVNCGECHFCFYFLTACPSAWIHYSEQDKTEQAYRILKLFVEKKIITEPDSYKKFCELIEEIAKVI